MVIEGAHPRLARLELGDQGDVARQDAELARFARDDDHARVLDEHRALGRDELDADPRGALARTHALAPAESSSAAASTSEMSPCR